MPLETRLISAASGRADNLIRFFHAYKTFYNSRSRLIVAGSYGGFDLYLAQLHGLVAAMVLGQQVPARWPWKAYWLIVAPALALGGFGANALTRALKRRVTFPRSGYVDWRPPDGRSRTRLAATIVVGAAMLAWAALSSRQPALEDRAPAVLSVIIAMRHCSVSVAALWIRCQSSLRNRNTYTPWASA